MMKVAVACLLSMGLMVAKRSDPRSFRFAETNSTTSEASPKPMTAAEAVSTGLIKAWDVPPRTATSKDPVAFAQIREHLGHSSSLGNKDDVGMARSSLLRMASAGVALAFAASKLPTTMSAAQYTANGDNIAELVNFVEVLVPQVKPGQVLIKVEYASANNVDLMVMRGDLKGAGFAMPFPFTLGYDVAGKIVADAEGFKEGQRVFAVNWGQGKHDNGGDPIGGAFAEYAVIPASKLTPIPDGLGSRDAAAVAMVGTTAYQIVIDCAKVTNGSKVLVLGGATAVGGLAVQLAKLRGASFVATTASTRNMEYVETLGADEVINYKQKDWTLDPMLKDLDAVIDTAGEQDVFAKAKGVLKKDGSFVSIANIDAGFDPSAHPPLSFAAYVAFSQNPQIQEKLAELLTRKSLKLKIDQEFPFTRAGIIAMLEKTKSRKSVGKNLLKVAASAGSELGGPTCCKCKDNGKAYCSRDGKCSSCSAFGGAAETKIAKSSTYCGKRSRSKGKRDYSCRSHFRS